VNRLQALVPHINLTPFATWACSLSSVAAHVDERQHGVQGTAADAKVMLEKTVAAIKADKAKTLDQINKGENGFLVGDLYPLLGAGRRGYSDCRRHWLHSEGQDHVRHRSVRRRLPQCRRRG